MRKFAIATTAIAMILGAGVASADSDRGRRVQSNQETAHHQIDRRSEARRRAPAVEIVKVGLHRRYYDEAIPLRRLLNLGRDYRGYRIQSVIVKVRPHRSRGRLALLANGYVVDRARAGEYRRIELRPDGDRTLGRDLNRLQLLVRGRAYIDSIQVKLRAPRHGRRAPQVHRTSDNHHELYPKLTEELLRIVAGQME